jgi:SAM-dependent methyltransferase
MKVRRQLAARYLSGSGIEIGALHMPLPLPSGASARYVDRAPVVTQRAWFPELSLLALAPVDIVDDAATLATIADETQDFVVANHVIEHMQDPVATIRQWLRVLPPGGILYFAVPDKRHTFDRARPVTSLEHVLRDFSDGPEQSFDEHIAEVARTVAGLSAEGIPRRIAEARSSNESPHFHVWTDGAFRELLEHCRTVLGFPISIEEITPVGNEFIVVLRKTSGKAPLLSAVLPRAATNPGGSAPAASQ